MLLSTWLSSAGLPQLVFTNGGDVMMADIHGRFARILVPSQGKGSAVGVAYSWHSDKIFWSDTYTKKVSLDHYWSLLFGQYSGHQSCYFVLLGLLSQLQWR